MELLLYRGIASQPRFADLDHGLGCLLRRLFEHVENHDRVGSDVINNPPDAVRVLHAELMTSLADARHGTRVRKRNALAALQATQQHACLDPGLGRKRRRLDFTVQPRQRLVGLGHEAQYMSNVTYPQTSPDARRRVEPAGAHLRISATPFL
jgi:hypothetical protein